MFFNMDSYISCGRLVLDDFPIGNISDELGLAIMNSLPRHIQGDIVAWGFSDTPTREAIFCELLQRIGFSDVADYYESEVARKFFKNGEDFSPIEVILTPS